MEVTHRKETIAGSALLLVNLIYGASHVLAKGVMPTYLTPTVFIFLRVIGAASLFWVISLITRIKPIERADLIRFMMCGLFGVTVNQLLFFHGLNASSPMNAGILMAINPILVAVLSFFWLKERLIKTQWVGIIIGSLGAIALTTYGSKSIETRWGDWYLLGNSLCYAVYLIAVKPLMQKYNPLHVITWVFTFGSFFLLLFPPLYAELPQTEFSGFPIDIWAKILFVIIGVTFLTYLLTVFGLKFVSSTLASVFIYVQPIVVILFSFVFFSLGWSADYTHAINQTTLLFMIVVFVGVYLTTNRSTHKTP